MPRMTSAQRIAIPGAVGLAVYDTDFKEFYYHDGITWKKILNNEFWNASTTRSWIYNINDSLGLGTSTPDVKLDVIGNVKTSARIDAGGIVEAGGLSSLGTLYVNGTSLLQGAITGNSSATFNSNITSNSAMIVNDPTAILQLQNAGVNKGFVQLSGDNLRLGTNSGNVDGEVIVRMDGTDRFRFEQSGRMTIIGDVNPTLYFSAGAVNKAYMQVQGNDLQIRAINNKVELGDFVTVDDALNRVGISTSTPEQKLHVQGGSAKISTGKVYNNSNENLMPLGYAVFNSSGTKLSGTANLSGDWIGNEFYLACANENINDASVFITCRNAKLFPSYVNETLGRVRINLYDENTDSFNASFSVIVYKTN